MKAVTDYNSYKLVDIECTEENINDIQYFANKTISELCCDGNNNLLTFPDDINLHTGDIASKYVCQISDISLKTGDIMGFIGYHNTSLTIRSRFAKEGQNDNFLHYMLKEVLNINFFDLKHNISQDSALELFIYLFPYHLKKALQQGLFKQYQTQYYNDANIRGGIDIPRHIRNNLPFTGKISYHTREFVYDNEITQLIRHTIEFINSQPIGKKILKRKDIEEYISLIKAATPSYSPHNLQAIVNKNLKPVQHPYYTHYRKLQQLCLLILKKKGMKYSNVNNKIYGILFSGSWLWEEYIGHILEKTHKHYYKNKGKRFYLFENPTQQQIIPDYIQWSSDGKRPIVVADAKYIRLDNGSHNYGEEKATAIYYKTITYMYYFDVSKGLLFYPSSVSESEQIKLKIKGTDSYIIKLPLKIPNGNISFDEFCKLMKIEEEKFKQQACISYD